MKDKSILTILLCTIVVLIAVIYAAFSTTLNINGTASVTSTWQVRFDQTADASTCSTSGDSRNTATITIDSDTVATMSASLYSPGDYAECRVKVVNEGTLPAKLNAITVSDPTVYESGVTAADVPITYTVTPTTSDLATRPTLVAQTGFEYITVRATYNADSNEVASNAKRKDVQVVATYVQDLSA